MPGTREKNVRTTRLLIAAVLLWVGGAALSGTAMAQTICNSSLVIGFPNGDNLNRTVGQTVRMNLTVTNGPSQNAGAPDSQTFTLIDFFPSCLSVVGGVCTLDPGEVAGAPPPIQYAGNLSTGNCPSTPLVDVSNPFDVKFTFSPPAVFNNTVGCTFSFDVLVTERGSNGTPANIAQLSSTNGVCGSTLTSQAGGTAAITLTCPPCNDGNTCNGVETCNTETAQCQPGTPIDCNDANACTADSCNPASGCVNNPQPPSFCDDQNACTDDSCAPASGCVHTPTPPSACDDNNECTDDSCDPQDGCVNVPADPMPPGCEAAICRTPGFWGTHAGTEKGSHSVNITEAVIDCVDGNCLNHTAGDFLLICGEHIDSPDSDPADGTTDTDDAASSTEAMCVPVKGASILQLARQLTAAALNCIISGGGGDCAGTPLYTTVFGDCNSKCSSGTATKAELTACISQLDCLNNGGSFNNGVCTKGGEGNCHERPLVNETLGLDFDPPGPAGSSNACNAATDTECTVVGPLESSCDNDSLP